MLLKEVSTSDKLHSLSNDTARLLWTWMLSQADINGCFYANPSIVKSFVFPLRDEMPVADVAGYLDEMENVGLIIRYEDNQYLYIVKFEEKQPKLHPDREGKPTIPQITHDKLMSKKKSLMSESPQIKLNKSKIKEDGGEQFYTCTYFSVGMDKAKEYASAYGIGLQQLKTELQKMKLWLDNNPTRRKTNYGRAIQNWLGRIKQPVPEVHGDGTRQMLDRVRRNKLAAAQGGNGAGHAAGHLKDAAGGKKGSEAAGEEVSTTKEAM